MALENKTSVPLADIPRPLMWAFAVLERRPDVKIDMGRYTLAVEQGSARHIPSKLRVWMYREPVLMEYLSRHPEKKITFRNFFPRGLIKAGDIPGLLKIAGASIKE